MRHLWLFCNPMNCSPARFLWPWNFPGKNTGVGCHFLLLGVFPTQRLNPGVPHCRWILYQLSHKGSLRIFEWLAYPFSSRSSWPRNQTEVSCIALRFCTKWAIREAPRRDTIMIKSNPIHLPGGWTTTWSTVIPKKFSHFCKGSAPHLRLPSLGIGQRD